MDTSDGTFDVNMDWLRSQLAGRVALLVITVSGLIMWRMLTWDPFPTVAFFLMLALLGMGGLVYGWAEKHSTMARHIVVWGFTTVLLAAMQIFSSPWLPFLGLRRSLLFQWVLQFWVAH